MREEEEIFNELLEDHPIYDMVKFNETDIHEKLQDNQMQVVRYKEFYYKELSILEELERKMEALMGIRYKHYRFNDDHEWQKPEIEKYCLPADEKILKMKKIISKQQVRVRFFDTCWRALDSMKWNMKNFSDREKWGV